MPRTLHTQEQVALAELLRVARQEVGLTQERLAERLRRRQSFVSKIESGERRIDLVELRELCIALGISLRTFIDRFEASIDHPVDVPKR